MTKVVIYRRVSTREQGDSQLGLEAQLTQCRTACESIGLSMGQTGNSDKIVR